MNDLSKIPKQSFISTPTLSNNNTNETLKQDIDENDKLKDQSIIENLQVSSLLKLVPNLIDLEEPDIYWDISGNSLLHQLDSEIEYEKELLFLNANNSDFPSSSTSV